ncbi:MAG TPA: glycoside hydrolase family 65 protein [Rhodanobacteraceae bacterium]|nr:glycoside hydrolase family 65 protein [Rhodanobacteraceae bacterium]
MKSRTSLILCLSLLAPFAPALAQHPTDPSFLLTATAKDFGTYFPSYLANGYFSTTTSVRGTEPGRAYMVAFMDYTKGDISRPAAIPGWSEIDYNAGAGWLNQTQLNPKTFSRYSQTLNMHDGTLSTSYRFTYGKTTDVQAVTFVSEADPHLAVTRLSITSQFSGKVQLQFPFRIWSGHQPRFPIATMSSEQMINAVIASGQNLNDKPIPTPDRAPVWYPGSTPVTNDGGDTRQLTLWLDGRAAEGLAMAEAAAIELPRGLKVESVKLEKTPDKLSLNVVADVRKGVTYTFTKYIAASRQDWGGDAKADLALATKARTTGFDGLLARHVAAWHDLWKSDIVVDHDEAVQRALHSDLYYLLSNTTVGTAWAMGACALTPNYAGHVFWDSDSWVFPALLLLHPERAKPIVMFRDRTMGPARAQAAQYGWKGLMYPWESDPQQGTVVTPNFASGVHREIHLDADVAIAQWQYYLATGDLEWLKQHGWPVIEGIAEFWKSRVTFDKAHDRYEILHVTSPDEAYDDVPNDTFTNAAAAKALRIATKAATLVGARPDPAWAEIAAKMYIPFNQTAQRHYDFDPSVPEDKITWFGSTLAWLMYPNLDLPMSPRVRRNDFAFQLQALETHGDSPNEMMMVMLTVGAAELGDASAVGHWIHQNLVGFLKPPFNVRTETADNNAGYILATSAGFVQSFIYGLSGLRIDGKGLDAEYAPILPSGWKSVTLKDITFRGKHYDITIERGANGKAALARKEL